MRKLYYALAIALLGLLVCACQIVFFPDYQNQEPGEGQKPEEEKPQGDDVDPVLKVKTFGMYNIDGEDFAYRRGFSQISRNYSADGKTLDFAILDPSKSVVYSLSGIKPSSALEGHTIYVTFSAKTPQKDIKSFSSSAKVLGVSGDTLWLKTSQGPYFVIKK